jgi:hypothetical protein
VIAQVVRRPSSEADKARTETIGDDPNREVTIYIGDSHMKVSIILSNGKGMDMKNN